MKKTPIDKHTQDVVDAVKEMAEKAQQKPLKGLTLIEILGIFLSHCGDNVKSVKLSGTRKQKRRRISK